MDARGKELQETRSSSLSEQAEQLGTLDKFLDIHLYITSVLPANNFKAVTLHLALDLMHKRVRRQLNCDKELALTFLCFFQTKRDLITGLKTRTRSGRPDWDDVFTRAREAKHGKVTVFYCGNPALTSTLLKKCDEYNFGFKKEIF